MKVLFVVPPYRTTDALVARLYPMPLAATSLAAVLEAAGHTVVIKDFLLPAVSSRTPAPASFAGKHAPAYMHWGTPIEDCTAWLEQNVPAFDVVCLCSCQCNVFETVEVLAQAIRTAGRPLVVGGPFVTTATEEAIDRFKPNVAVIGEGEAVIERAIELALTYSPNLFVLRGSPVDVDALPLPAWHLAPPADYPKNDGKTRGVLTVTRGCPHGCTFCSVATVMGRKMRRMNAQNIRRQIMHLWEAGVRYFSFLDDNLFSSPAAVSDVLGTIEELREVVPGFKRARFYVEEGLEVRMVAQPGLVARLVQSNFEHIAIGLETLNETTRAAVEKPYSSAQLDRAIEECNKAGAVARAFYIVGLPGDSVRSVTRDLVKFGQTGLAVRPNNLKIYPGTLLHQQYVSKGLVPAAGFDWRLSTFWTPNTPDLTFEQVRRLKTVLGAIGFAAEEFGLSLFKDSLPEIKEAFLRCKFTLQVKKNALTLTGQMYRETPYRHMLHLLQLRMGNRGAKSKVLPDGSIVAFACSAPQDDVQDALGKALIDAECTFKEVLP